MGRKAIAKIAALRERMERLVERMAGGIFAERRGGRVASENHTAPTSSKQDEYARRASSHKTLPQSDSLDPRAMQC